MIPAKDRNVLLQDRHEILIARAGGIFFAKQPGVPFKDLLELRAFLNPLANGSR